MKAQLNSFQGIGNLVRDPKIRKAGAHTIAELTVAITAGYGDKEKTYWCRTEVWNKTAEFVERHMKNGDCVLVCGEMVTDEWTDKEGEKKSTTKLQCRDIQKLNWEPREQRPVTTTRYDARDDDEPRRSKIDELRQGAPEADQDIPF